MNIFLKQNRNVFRLLGLRGKKLLDLVNPALNLCILESELISLRRKSFAQLLVIRQRHDIFTFLLCNLFYYCPKYSQL